MQRLEVRLLLRRALPGILTGLAALLILPGCQTEPRELIPGVITNVTQDDIPIPRDFVQSSTTENWAYIQYSEGPARFRSWVGEYVGYRQIRDLLPWYVSQMTQDGWHHEGTEEGDQKILKFTNLADEEALVIFDRRYDPHQDRFQTRIRVEIGPMPTENMDVHEILELPTFPASRNPGATGRPVPAAGTTGQAPGNSGLDTLETASSSTPAPRNPGAGARAPLEARTETELTDSSPLLEEAAEPEEVLDPTGTDFDRIEEEASDLAGATGSALPDPGSLDPEKNEPETSADLATEAEKATMEGSFSEPLPGGDAVEGDAVEGKAVATPATEAETTPPAGEESSPADPDAGIVGAAHKETESTPEVEPEPLGPRLPDIFLKKEGS